MITLKAFVQINNLINNNLATLAPIGEMSPIGFTYSREKAIYSTAETPGLELNVYAINNNDVPMAEWDAATLDAALGTSHASHVANMLEICEWVYVQALSGRFSQNADNFKSQYLAQWGDTYSLNESGLMTQGVNMWCPAFIDISFNNRDAVANRSRIWFSGEAFDAQFDEFEIKVVDPITNIDDFFTGYTHVKALVDAVTVSQLMEKIQLVKDGYPDTNVVTTAFDWIDPINRTLIKSVDWTTVIYGAAGDNLDSIKAAIVKHVLAHSTHPLVEWEVIFPDIFTATEFIITPMWNHYSIPNRELEAGLYSPIVPIDDAIALSVATAKGTGYTEVHVKDVLQIAANTYKSISLSIVGGPQNRNGINKFNQQFKDYLSIPSTNLDFQRMDKKTRDFVLILSGMLRFAESMTLTSSVPREHTRTIRDGIVYLSRTFDRVQYLVVTKFSLNDPTNGIPDVLLDGDGYVLVNAEAEELN